MIFISEARYAAHLTKDVIKVFTDPNNPQRPEFAKELATVVYGDQDGFHTIIVVEVDDAKVGEYLQFIADRSLYMESRVEGLSIKVHNGLSIPDAIGRAQQFAV